jgi:MFS family permease
MLVCMESLGELETPPSAAAPESTHNIFLESPVANGTLSPTSHHGHHELPSHARWLLSVGIGSAVIVAAALGLLSDEYSLRIRRRWTITIRFAVGAVTILVPLMTNKDVSIVGFLSIIASLTFFGALVSLIGGLRKPRSKIPVYTPPPPALEEAIDEDDSE